MRPRISHRVRAGLALAAWLLVAAPAGAFTITVQAADFGVSPVFSDVVSFRYTIEVAGPLAPGIYDDPALVGVDYRVFGSLADGTPSGFPAFDLRRTMNGAEFYAQGSSLRFEIAAGADLSDGLQVAELVGSTNVFVLDALELGTGRYHPSLVRLDADGTGDVQNSSNQGGINPATMEEVDVELGEEYVTALSFDPAAVTLAVPEPSTAALTALGLAALAARRRRAS